MTGCGAVAGQRGISLAHNQDVRADIKKGMYTWARAEEAARSLNVETGSVGSS